MTVSMLAIATQNPNAVAETYVRQHVRRLAPGRTALVGLACTEEPRLDVPALCLTPTQGKLQSLTNLLRTGYTGGVTGAVARELDRFIDAHGIEVVLAEFGPTGAALRAFCKSRGLPLHVFFHGYDATVMPRSVKVRHAYRLLARDADGFMCGSRYFKAKLERMGFPGERIAVSPGGVELSDFAPSSARDPKLLVGVGRLTAKKAPHHTIAAFAKARESVPDLKLELVGGGPLRAECDAMVARLGLDDGVTLHGAQDHAFVKALLARAGIFVQHSVTAPNGDEESQGISLLEAMASGLPVVTTRHNGFPETVVDGETGLLSDEHDVAAMAANIVRIAQSEETRIAFGAAGRRRAEEAFDADVLAAKLREHLVRGLRSAAPRPQLPLAERTDG
jgi:glycosyltransferase involved in cell wall biosynthesis